jgi:opacity protein-like surface antigen
MLVESAPPVQEACFAEKNPMKEPPKFSRPIARQEIGSAQMIPLRTYTMKTRILSAVTSFLLLISAAAFAQNFEITGHAGYQLNGGLDNFSTTLFDRLEVENGSNYGVTVGYLPGDLLGLEFDWTHSHADTLAEPFGGGQDVKLFSLNQNQYMGNIVWHFTPKEEKVRPFAFVGFGANNLSASRENVNSATKFAWAVGGGGKYNISKHFAVKGTLRYAPTYITTTSTGGYWCDPFWGGCWVAGESHYLHALDFNGGVTFRF